MANKIMRILNRGVLWFAMLTILLAFNHVFAQSDGFELPDYQNVYVNDYDNLLNVFSEQKILRYLEQVKLNGGPEITLLTISSLADYNAGPSIEPFATELFNYWGVGDAEQNDGVMILVSAYDRKMRIELGAGYSSSYDQTMKDVIDDYFIPYFKKDQYQQGIENGVVETIYAITGRYPDEIGNSFISKAKRSLFRWIENIGLWLIAPFAAIAMFVVNIARKLWRARPRRCRVCQSKMSILDEDTDDIHLDEGQRLEEYLQSIDYDVWQCGICQTTAIHQYSSWFSSYLSCPECNYKTMGVETTVLKRATTRSTGRKRLDYNCQKCDFSDTEFATIPRVSKSSSSSSSGSFGGGSSSGGGASGSW